MSVIRKQKTLKKTNRKVILNILRISGEVSISELSKKVNLSKPTLMNIMNYYIKKGLVVITGKGRSTEEGGKKPNIFKINSSAGYAIGMAILANKLISIVTDLKGKILEKISVDLETDEKFDSVLKKINNSYKKIVNNNMNGKKVIGLAVGTYGITNFDNGVIIYSPHFPSWGENIELKKKILEQLPNKTAIFIDNGVRFQAFAEKTFGVAKKEENIIAIQAGKGLAAGIIAENKIKRGKHYIVGEIGHMLINPEGKEVCACGGKGCFEVMVSTNRILRRAKEKFNDYPESLIFNEKDIDKINMYDIFDALKKKDKLAIELIDDVINWFSIGISNIILTNDPQIVVIQGIFTKAGKYFLDNLKEKINKISLQKIKKETDIKYSELGDNVCALGAASYVLSKYFE
jgi:predicted NBD/HSP70 family sugar kinase/predicted transcriptional regulator